MLSVEAPTVLPASEPAPMRIMGAAPVAPVTVTVSLTDTAGRDWTGTTMVRSDGRGRAALRPGPADPPGLQGLIQRLNPPEAGAQAQFADSTTVSIQATDGAGTDDATLRRRVVPRGTTVAEPGAGLAGRYLEPAGTDPNPAILALHGAGGEPATQVAGALSARGFAVLAQQYFGPDVPDAPATLREVPLCVFDRAIDQLKTESGAESVGIVASSRGTEAAMLVAARRDDIEAIVAFSPSAYVTYALDNGPTAASPWRTSTGPLPHLPPQPVSDTGDPIRHRPGYERAVSEASETRRKRAALPAQDVEADVLLISGTDDAVWPSTPWAETVAARLGDRGTHARCAHRRYEEAGHDIGVPYRPTTVRVGANGMALGGTAAATARAEADAWPTVVDWLREGDRK